MIDFVDRGADYTLALCSAIERYTEHRAAHGSYTYHGMQLRYAVERYLYVYGVNSEPLFSLYETGDWKDATAPRSPAHAVASSLAPFITPQPVVPNVMVAGVPSRIRTAARRLYLFGRSRLKFRRPHRAAGLGPDVLVQIGSARFASYLNPILARLGPDVTFGFLVSPGELATELSGRGYPLTWSNDVPISWASLAPSGALVGYDALLHIADTFIASLRRLRPKVVIVVEGNAPEDILMSEACKILSIPCFCIQQGWSPIVHNGFRNMSFSGMFVWGTRFAQVLAPWNPQQIFHVAGHHGLPFDRIDSTRVRREQRLQVGFFLQSPCALLGVKAYEEFIQTISRIASRFPELVIVVREHPVHPLTDELKSPLMAQRNIRFSDPRSEDLHSLLAECDIAASVFSTVLLEALAMQVIPMIFEYGALRGYLGDIVSAGAGMAVQSEGQAIHAFSRILSNPAMLADMRARQLGEASRYFASGDACQVVADHLMAAAASRIPPP